jgi:hypothetical protein
VTIVPILIVVGLVVAGGVYFAYLMKFQRQVLKHERPPADEREGVAHPAGA